MSSEPSPTQVEIQARLEVWEAEYGRVKRPSTIKAMRSDWSAFSAWCERTHASPLPATPQTLLRYLGDQAVLGKKAATLNRYVNSIRIRHKAAELRCPTAHPTWSAGWQIVLDQLAEFDLVEPKQAAALTGADVDTMLEALGGSLLDLRDAALVRLAADTLCRESELTQVRIEDFKCSATGWVLYVPSSPNGTERRATEETKAAVDAWCAAAVIKAGFLFLPVGRNNTVDQRIQPIRPKEVARIFRTRALRANIPDAASVTGHSIRAGAAVEMLKNGAAVQDVQAAGAWLSQRMVLQYARMAR